MENELVELPDSARLRVVGAETEDHSVPVPVAVDLSPMIFDRVQYNGRTLVLRPPLTLTPRLDQESGQFGLRQRQTKLQDNACSICPCHS